MIGSMIWCGQATDSGTASRHRANVTTTDRWQAAHTVNGRHVITHDTVRAINDGVSAFEAKADMRW
jgi:hypothetical protein